MVERLLRAVYELSTVPPHRRTDTEYGDAERRAYHEGYYCALSMALRVMGNEQTNEERRATMARESTPRRKAG